MDIALVKQKADMVRKYVCQMCLIAKSGHPTSSLSCTDIIATLYFSHMKRSKDMPLKEQDSFILSKGHAAPALYAALIVDEVLPEDLVGSLRKIDSPLQGHPDAVRLPEVGASTGALGQGLSMAIGRALSMKMDRSDRYSYCIIGDGESQEGQVWEAALFGGNRNLSNLIAFCDSNKGQSDGKVSEIMPLGDIAQKWSAFGWFTQEIDGHNLEEINDAIEKAKNKNDQRPSMIIANTKKGYIVADRNILKDSHSSAMDEDSYQQVLEALGLA